MRNLGTRFNESNIIDVYGSDHEERLAATSVLVRALEAVPGRLTPSEDRVISGFLAWYDSINSKHPYRSTHPAYAYVNLNTGVNLLFLVAVPYEGCRGGTWRHTVDRMPLQAEQFD